jgi:uncharacterized membrane protein YoaK (UPF0700 family)
VEASPERPDAAPRAEPLLLALSLLTLVTGLVDAACYLGLGRVFTANMTGNVVLLAFGAAGAQGLPVLAPTVSLAVFLAGAAAGGRLASRLVGPAGAEVPAAVRRRWVMIALLAELLLVVVAGVVAVGLPVDAAGARRYVVIGLLAAGLGLQNATVRRLAVPDVTTTVLTLTLTGLAADSWLAGGHSPRIGRRLAAVGLMAAGALAGALLLRVDVALPVLAAAVVIALAAVALRFGRQERPYALSRGLGCRLDGNPVVTMAAGRTAPGPSTCRHLGCWSCEPLPNQQRARGWNPVTGGPAGDGGYRFMAALRPSPRRPEG